MLDFLVNAGLLLVILGTSAMATKAYVNAMYNKCPACAGLNAKRRTACRLCGATIARQAADNRDEAGA